MSYLDFDHADSTVAAQQFIQNQFGNGRDEQPPWLVDDNPEWAPVGAVRVWPRWQDEHHETGGAIRWTLDPDEQYPWLLLDSDGPQRLDHDAVRGCQVRPDIPLPTRPCCRHAANMHTRKGCEGCVCSARTDAEPW